MYFAIKTAFLYTSICTLKNDKFYIGGSFLVGIRSVLGIDADAAQALYSPFASHPQLDRYLKWDNF
jgi:hypothetical protein